MATEQLPLFETEVKKRCTKCGEFKGLDKYAKAKFGKHGRSAVCKECKADYYQANKESIKAKNKIHRDANKEAIAIRAKKYYLNNKEKVKFNVNVYRNRNKDIVKQRKRLYYLDNKDRLCKKSRKRYVEKIDEIKVKSKEYREKNYKQIKESGRIYREANRAKIRKYQNERYHNVVAKDPMKILRGRISGGMRKSLLNGKNGMSWEKLMDYDASDLVKHLKRNMPEGYSWKDFKNNPSFFHIDHIIPVTAFNFDSINHLDFYRCWDLKNLQLLPAIENLKKNNKIDKPFQPSLELSFR